MEKLVAIVNNYLHINIDNHYYFFIFEPLRNVEFFRKFTLDSWTMVWPNEVDFAPEYLYDLAIKQNEKTHNTVTVNN